MPLVRICLMQGKSVEFRHKMGEIVYQTIVDTINVLPKGNFQIITEHDEISLVEVKKERCDSEAGLLNKRSGPLGLKSYKYLDTLTKKPIISTDVLPLVTLISKLFEWLGKPESRLQVYIIMRHSVKPNIL